MDSQYSIQSRVFSVFSCLKKYRYCIEIMEERQVRQPSGQLAPTDAPRSQLASHVGNLPQATLS